MIAYPDADARVRDADFDKCVSAQLFPTSRALSQPLSLGVLKHGMNAPELASLAAIEQRASPRGWRVTLVPHGLGSLEMSSSRLCRQLQRLCHGDFGRPRLVGACFAYEGARLCRGYSSA